MLYIRMFFVIGLNLYTSRLILDALGVSDFGLYGIVGGIVTMMSFLNNSLAGATQRFLTFELGKKDYDKLKQVFNASFFNHALIGLAVLVLGETVGLWFVNHKLNIPEGRMLAANVVFQVSLLTACVNFLKVPFTGSIIAHERMGIFSIVSIGEVLIKTGLIVILSFITADRLIVYSFFLFGLSCLVLLVLWWACRRNFSECRDISFRQYKFVDAKPMLYFSGWDLYGNFSFVARNEGMNVLLNIFFGTLMNASVSIANRVESAISGFAQNFLTAVQPQIVKQYAEGKFEEMQVLVRNSAMFAAVLLSAVALPVILYTDYILGLWLVEVPEYTAQFCQIVLVGEITRVMFTPLLQIFYATGDIKKMSFVLGTILLLTLPINYLLLLYYKNPILVLIINASSYLFRGIAGLYLLKMKHSGFEVRKYIYIGLLKPGIIAAMALGVAFVVKCHLFVEDSFAGLVVICVILTTLIAALTYFFGIDKEMRNKVNHYVGDKLNIGK